MCDASSPEILDTSTSGRIITHSLDFVFSSLSFPSSTGEKINFLRLLGDIYNSPHEMYAKNLLLLFFLLLLLLSLSQDSKSLDSSFLLFSNASKYLDQENDFLNLSVLDEIGQNGDKRLHIFVYAVPNYLR